MALARIISAGLSPDESTLPPGEALAVNRTKSREGHVFEPFAVNQSGNPAVSGSHGFGTIG